METSGLEKSLGLARNRAGFGSVQATEFYLGLVGNAITKDERERIMERAYREGSRFALDSATDFVMIDEYRTALEFMQIAFSYSLQTDRPLRPRDIKCFFDLADFRRKSVSIREKREFLFGIGKLFFRTVMSS